MKRFQMQHHGVASQGQSPLTNSEFECNMEVYWWIPSRELGLVGAAASTFQLSTIAGQEDTSKFREADLQPYALYPYYGVIHQLPWSKNITDERDAPPQVIFGAMGTRYDFMSNGGLWLEYHYTLNPRDNEVIFGHEG